MTVTAILHFVETIFTRGYCFVHLGHSYMPVDRPFDVWKYGLATWTRLQKRQTWITSYTCRPVRPETSDIVIAWKSRPVCYFSKIATLPRVQNAAARMVLNLRPRDSISDGLRQLHWLPIESRIQFKLCLIMHLIHTGRCPSYISDTVQLVADRASHIQVFVLLQLHDTFYQDCALSLGSVPSRSLALRPGIRFRIDFIDWSNHFLKNTAQNISIQSLYLVSNLFL